MLETHPEFRLVAVLAAIVLVAAAGVLTAAGVTRGGTGAPGHGAAQATEIPASSATRAMPAELPTAARTIGPAFDAAQQVGRELALAYVDYDYHQGAPSGDTIRPFATQRLYWQVTQGGQDTAGNPAPWTAITLGADEVVTASVASVTAQLADANDAAVQVVLAEHDSTAGGTWEGRRQEDLGLVLQGARWLVDQVTQVGAGPG